MYSVVLYWECSNANRVLSIRRYGISARHDARNAVAARLVADQFLVGHSAFDLM
jgi:hypothetical protein